MPKMKVTWTEVRHVEYETVLDTKTKKDAIIAIQENEDEIRTSVEKVQSDELARVIVTSVKEITDA